MSNEHACAACRERLPWYVAGSLAAEERAAVERHLFTCARCQRERDACRAISALVQRADQMIPPDTHLISGWEALAAQLPRQPRLGNMERQGRIKMEDTEQRTQEHPETLIPPRADERPTPGAAPPARRRWLPAVAVTLLVVLLSVALFIGRLGIKVGAPAVPQATSTPVSVSVHQLAADEVLPGILLSAVQMLSPSEGWAVGEKEATQDLENGATGMTYNGVILHYTNGRWAVSATHPLAYLYSISMVSPTEGWAAGTDYSTFPLLLHYTGGRWVRFAIQDAANTQIVIHQVQMLSADEGWAIGRNSVMNNPSTYYLLHYLHGTWTVNEKKLRLLSFSMLSATDGWAVGRLGVIARYQQGQWVSVRSPVDVDLSAVQMCSASDGWAVGTDWNASSRAVLLHFDGHAWTRVNPAALPADTDARSFPQQFALLPTGEGWAVGVSAQADGPPAPFCPGEPPGCFQQDQRSIIWHHLGSRWELLGSEFNAFLTSISMLSADEGWAVGNTAALSGVFPDAGVLLHYSNGAWTPYTGWGK